MENKILQNKKIGIWGFGIVGKSAYDHVKKFTNFIEILDKKEIANNQIIKETPQTIKNFLTTNEIIISSPGVPLHQYKKFHYKFLSELDIFTEHCKNKTIAITGTLGKTTTTTFLEQCLPSSISAGNIGYPMLNLLNQDLENKTILLELSSYQLQYCKNFAPDLAILTNFYPNHLDHHKTKKEYFLSKCNIFKFQNQNQRALLPYALYHKITKHIKINAQVYLFSKHKPRKEILFPIFFISQNNLILRKNSIDIIIFENIKQLAQSTFIENWLIIIASLYLQNKPLQKVVQIEQGLKKQEHRLEFVAQINNTQFYNDSKSTVWQATRQALQAFKQKKCALLLGGLSKGTDRTPLIKYLQHKKITVFAFGKEAHHLKQLCDQFKIPCFSYNTMNEAFDQAFKQKNDFDIILLSPAGSSFDLFKNYQERGTIFKKLVNQAS